MQSLFSRCPPVWPEPLSSRIDAFPFARSVHRGDVDDAALRILAAERRHGVRLIDEAEEAELAMWTSGPWVDDDEMMERLWAFLDDVPLIVTGGDFCNDWAFLFQRSRFHAGGFAAFTWRAWGARIAEWCNARLGGGYGYLDFYMGPFDVPGIDDERQWTEVVVAALLTKARLTREARASARAVEARRDLERGR